MEFAIDTFPGLFLSTNEDGIVSQINLSFADALGYSKGQITGFHIDNISTISTRIFYQTHLYPLLRIAGKAEEIFVTFLTKDKQELPILVNVQRVDKDGQTSINYGGILVHNRKKFEEDLIAARKIAETALHENSLLIKTQSSLQKYVEQLDEKLVVIRSYNDELKQVNQVLTHDLYEPLRKMLLYTSSLMEKNSTPELKKLRKLSEQMRSVLNGLQQFAWLADDELKPEKVDLNLLINETIAILKREHPSITILVEKQEIPPLVGDGDQLKFLIYQVLSNCVRFRKHDNCISIKIEATTMLLNRFRAMPDKYKYEEYLKLIITDDGIGFPSEFNDQPFVLFKRLHPVSGQGIGLKLSKKIVDDHMGDISIASQVGKGAAVTILLPLDFHIRARKTDFVVPKINQQ